MNCREHLAQFPLHKVRLIAEQLRVTLPETASEAYIKHCIVNILTNWDELYKRVLKWVDRNEQDKWCLRQLLFTGRTIINTSCLEKYGLVLNKEIPDDVALLLKDKLRKELVQEFDLPGTFLPSAYLQMLLIVNTIKTEKKPMTSGKLLKTLGKKFGFLDIQLADTLLSYMELRRIVSKDDKKNFKLCPNYNELFSDVVKLLNLYDDLYDRLFEEYGLRDLEWFLKKVSEIQQDDNEWICVDVFRDVSRAAPLWEKGSNTFGLFNIHIEKGKYFVSLNPDGWYLSKRQRPLAWGEKSILISADFEAFLPHNFDPVVIMEFIKNCHLRVVDYLAVFEVPLDTKWHFSDHFINLVLDNALHLPDVVRYELLRKTRRLLPPTDFKGSSSR